MPSTVVFPTDELTPADVLRQQIAHQVEEAFARTPYPGDERICRAGADGGDLMRAFRGKAWADVQLATLLNYHIDMPIMTPEAFRYYLPAFMLAVLFFYQHSGTLPMSLLHNLTPPDASSLHDYMEKTQPSSKRSQIDEFLNRVSAFTPAERAAIRAYLESYRKLHPHGRSEMRYLDRAMAFWQMA